jgi:hypothetical protein
MSFGIKKATAGAPVSGAASNLRRVRVRTEITKGERRPPQDSKHTRGDTKGPGR